MTPKAAEFLVNLLENAGEEASIYEDYSGRGMFGRTTTGISCDLHPVQWIPIIMGWVKENVNKCEDGTGFTFWDGGEIPDIESLKIDNLGMGWIIY